MNPDETISPRTNVYDVMTLSYASLISVGVNYMIDPLNQNQLNK